MRGHSERPQVGATGESVSSLREYKRIYYSGVWLVDCARTLAVASLDTSVDDYE